MRKILSVLFMGVAGCLLLSCSAKNFIFVGTYTKNDPNGMYVFSFSPKDGNLLPVSHTQNVNDPSYLALSGNKKFLYAVNEGKDSVSAFSFDAKTGSLHLLNSQPSLGGAPCYIAIDHTQKFLTVANYTGGNLVVFPLAANGEILPAVQNIPLGLKQQNKASHAHTTVFSSDNRSLFVTDLGADKLHRYRFSANEKMPVAAGETYSLPAGSGPRHIALAQKENFIYVLNEWAGSIIVLKKDGQAYQIAQTIASTDKTPPGTKNRGSAAIKISPDNQFLYASNRGITNNITIYKIGKDGLLSQAGEQPTDTHPRDFLIDKTGKYLLAASRDGNSIKVYKRNKQTGLLSVTNISAHISMPVMLLEY